MSETQELPEVRHAEVTLQKCKVGPITARYQSGGYTDIDTQQTSDKPTRYAVLGLDRSHSKDYKVSYASDTVLVFTGEIGTTHDQLEKVLKENNLWSETLTPIEVPHGTDKWKVGFKTSPRNTRFDLYSSIMEENVHREIDYRSGKNGCSAFLPHK